MAAHPCVTVCMKQSSPCILTYPWALCYACCLSHPPPCQGFHLQCHHHCLLRGPSEHSGAGHPHPQQQHHLPANVHRQPGQHPPVDWLWICEYQLLAGQNITLCASCVLFHLCIKIVQSRLVLVAVVQWSQYSKPSAHVVDRARRSVICWQCSCLLS